MDQKQWKKLLNENTLVNETKMGAQKESAKLGDKLVIDVMNETGKIIDKFLKKEVYDKNLKYDVDDIPLDRDVVLKALAEGMLNYFEGMQRSAEQSLKKKK